MKNLTILVLLSLSFGQFQPQTKAELQAAVNVWADDNATALSIYGEINTWNVSLITDMTYLFYWKSFDGYSDNIGNWDVQNVTNFFEKRVSEYQRPKDRALSFDEAF